jgi:hypothetical protein
MFFGGVPQKVEPPVPLDREQVTARLREDYPEALRSLGVGGAVLLRVDVDPQGRAGNVRARGSRILGLIPRPGPRVYHPVTGRAVGGLSWANEPALLRAAERSLEGARFIAGAVNGVPVPARNHRLVAYFAPDLAFGARDIVLETGLLTPC